MGNPVPWGTQPGPRPQHTCGPSTHIQGQTRGSESPRGGGCLPGKQPRARPAAGGDPKPGRQEAGKRPGPAPAHLLRVLGEDSVEGEHLRDRGGGRASGARAARGPGGRVIEGHLLLPWVHLQEARGLGGALGPLGGPDPQHDLHLGGQVGRPLSTTLPPGAAVNDRAGRGRAEPGESGRRPGLGGGPAAGMQARTPAPGQSPGGQRGRQRARLGTWAPDRTGPRDRGKPGGRGGEARTGGRLWTPPRAEGQRAGTDPVTLPALDGGSSTPSRGLQCRTGGPRGSERLRASQPHTHPQRGQRPGWGGHMATPRPRPLR